MVDHHWFHLPKRIHRHELELNELRFECFVCGVLSPGRCSVLNELMLEWDFRSKNEAKINFILLELLKIGSHHACTLILPGQLHYFIASKKRELKFRSIACEKANKMLINFRFKSMRQRNISAFLNSILFFSLSFRSFHRFLLQSINCLSKEVQPFIVSDVRTRINRKSPLSVRFIVRSTSKQERYKRTSFVLHWPRGEYFLRFAPSVDRFSDGWRVSGRVSVCSCSCWLKFHKYRSGCETERKPKKRWVANKHRMCG